ncbi:DUF4113 domain-containing protein [Hydrogenophaga sp. BPS33]|uniref:DUF4113 domain-containing protein n=1 Tax=Hydrogenophaga sp. BPS33 TaxID=2651974 RepID=UPI001F3A9E1A|nr:DUF4113 domain-containing protein [Hydrogenophaga sp. BPS33]
MDLAQIYNLAALPSSDLDALLRTTDVSEVWGVRPRIGKQLKEGEIQTVLDFVRMDPATVRRRWGVSLERTLRELQGLQCIELDSAPGPKKQIACTRSFGKPIHELPPLIEAVSEFAGRAAEKLRAQDSVATEMLEFVHTSPHRAGPQLSRSIVVQLPKPTADTLALVQAAADGMRCMYAPGYRFSKAGVILVDLLPASMQQGNLDFDAPAEPAHNGARERLMVAMDAINGRFGKGSVHSASTGKAGPPREWDMKQERRTPQYTTRFEDIWASPSFPDGLLSPSSLAQSQLG